MKVVNYSQRNPSADRQWMIGKPFAINELEGHFQIVEHTLWCAVAFDRYDVRFRATLEYPRVVLEHVLLAPVNHSAGGHLPHDVVVVEMFEHRKLFRVLEYKVPMSQP